MKTLENKVAVITGGTRGLGLGIAELYAAEGANIVIAGRSTSSTENALTTLRANGLQAEGIACDVGNLNQVQSLAEYAMSTFGKIDIWVNNAGVSAPYGPTPNIPKSVFLGVIDTNILGMYYGSMVALKYMLPQQSGKLINLIGRHNENGVKFQNAYSASKSWVRSFTLALAKEYKESGVDIFAYNPGLVDTDMLRHVEAVKGYEARMKPLETVMRLWANPPKVPAEKALWLASSASDGKTGKLVDVLDVRSQVGGLLREAKRIIMRKPAPDTSLDIATVDIDDQW